MPIIQFTISRDDYTYEAWPAVTLTKQGCLICVFTECTHHGDRTNTRVVMTKSTDRGRSWSEKVPLTEHTRGLGYYYDCASITRLKDNRLAVVTNRIYNSAVGSDSAYWHETSNDLLIGDEEGFNWGKPIETPVKGIVPDTLCELSSGRWLLAAHSKSDVHGCLEQKLWYTDDQGEHWYGPITVASQAGLNLCECSIVPLPDGTLVAFMRENSGDGSDGYKAISTDNGETWHGPYRIPLPGCHRPVARVLDSGKIMITYRFMQGGKGWLGNWTQNFFAALTDIDSALATERNEQWMRIMPIDYDRSPVSDLGYSGWVQFSDGEIYIVNYIVDDAPNGQIRGYSLREEDFMIQSPSG